MQLLQSKPILRVENGTKCADPIPALSFTIMMRSKLPSLSFSKTLPSQATSPEEGEKRPLFIQKQPQWQPYAGANFFYERRWVYSYYCTSGNWSECRACTFYERINVILKTRMHCCFQFSMVRKKSMPWGLTAMFKEGNGCNESRHVSVLFWTLLLAHTVQSKRDLLVDGSLENILTKGILIS